MLGGQSVLLKCRLSPQKKDYRIEEKEIEWLPEGRQMAVINEISPAHRPIFLWLKLHLRRPAEAMALHRENFDPGAGVFTICRSVSARKVVDQTKTGAVHTVPCHPEFMDTAQRVYRRPGKYFFTHTLSRSDGHRYSHSTLSRLWKEACKKCGEDIRLYAGQKQLMQPVCEIHFACQHLDLS